MEKLRSIFENAKVGIAVCNAVDNRLEMVNPAFAEIHGYEPHELIGTMPGEIYALECMYRPGSHSSCSFSCTCGDVSFESVHIRKDGSPVPVSVFITPVKDAAGRQTHRIVNVIDISERKHDEEHLQRTKAKLSAVISTIPDLIWVKDIQGVYLLCNPSFERFFGAECGEIIGKTDYDFISRAQADFFRQKDREAMEAGEMRINEEEIVFAADGRRALLETRKIPVYSGGEFMGVLGIGRDITETRSAEREIIESAEFIRGILGALPDLLFEIDKKGTYHNVWTNDERLLAAQKEVLLGRTISEILDPVNADICMDAIRVADEAGKCIGHQITIDLPTGRKWFELSVSKISPNGDRFLTLSRDITERKLYEIELALSNEKFRTLAENTLDTIARYDHECRRTYANGAFAALAGKSPQQLLGVKPTDYVDSPQARSYEEALLRVHRSGVDETFEYVWPDKSGNMLTSHIHIVPEKDEAGNVYSVLATGRDVTRQKEADWMLRTLTSALNVSSESVFLIDLLSGRFVYVNDTASNQLGYTKEELTGGMGVLDIDPDFTPDLWNQHIDDLLNLDNVTIETRHRTKTGRIYPVEVVAHYFEYEERRYNLAVVRDITEKKAHENALLASEQKYRSLTENSPDAIVRYDRNLRRVYVNPAWEKINAVHAGEVIGKTPTERSFRISHMAESYEARLRRVMDEGKNAEIELWWHDEEGQKIHYNMCAVPEFDDTGSVTGILTISRDVTRVRQYEEKLRQNEERLREAQKIARIGSWELTFPHMSLSWSDEIYRIFELEPGSVSPDYACFIGIVHPDDRQAVDSAFYESLEEKSPYEIVHRLLMKNGRIKYVHERGETYYDEEGYPIRTLGTVQDITDQKAVEKKIEHMAHHDALTSLPNRTLAGQRMEAAIIQARDTGTKAALLFIDLDGFKTVNDTLGHTVGDAMLKVVATRLKECVRSADTVARLGGDEFLVILPGIENCDDVIKVAEKMLGMVEAPCHVFNHFLSVSMSIGIALYPDHGESFASLLQKSDTAMYKAKESGKNTYRFYDETMNHILAGQFKMQNDLKQAIAERQLVLYYQPQIELCDNRLSGVEALIRWKHPELGMVPPMQFIPLAESSGLIIPIGEWVIREACAQVARWHDMGMEITVAVNISAAQFKRGNLCDIVERAIGDSGISPAFIELELTESIMMQDTEKTFETVMELKKLGVQLSIDDFGTGYSSLAYLKRFAVDKLKIDQSFVRDITKDHDDAVIVRTIVQMAKNLNLKTIAEGVEDGDSLAILREYGCDEVQGYHFARPMEAASIEEFYRDFAGTSGDSGH